MFHGLFDVNYLGFHGNSQVSTKVIYSYFETLRLLWP